MLEITFYKDSQDRLSSFYASGHAGWADEEQDIVCAAVSAILQAARLGLASYAAVNVQVTQRKGEMRLEWPAEVRSEESVRAIVTTAELAVQQIAEQFPEHVRFRNQPEG